MLKIPFLPGFSFAKAPTYADFVSTLPPEGCTLHNLGASSDPTKDVYGLSIGDINNKPVIYIEGSIHGAHEWRCAHWIHEFMSIIANPGNIPQEGLINELKTRFSFFAIPCLNPYGYENNTYQNANGVNLNRNFDAYWEQYPAYEPWRSQYKGTAPFSEPETQIVRDIVLQYKPVVFIDNHTWGGFNGSNLEIELASRRYGILLEDLTKSMRLTLGRQDLQVNYFGNPAPRSSEWAGRQVSRIGTPIIAVTFEPGSLESEYEQARIGLNAILMVCYYVMRWFEERILVLD